MTIPKNAGLSRLAEAASPIEYYPVKRRGQKRSLFPNYAAIEWLESDSADDTEIEYEEAMDGTGAELNVTFAYGRGIKSYPRPMFQIIPRDAFSGSRLSVTPCSCDRFDLSWDATRCDAHAEVEWDWERKCWKRDTGPTAYYSPEAAAPTSDYGQSILTRLYEQINAVANGRCECALCRASRGDAPRVDGRLNFDANTQAIERRRQYEAQANLYAQGSGVQVYDFLQDRYVTDERFGTPGRPLPEVSPSAYGPDSRPISEAEATSIWDSIREADEAVQAREDARLRGLVAGLPSFSVTLEGTFDPGTFRLEVNGETLQGIQSFSIEVEPNDETRR